MDNREVFINNKDVEIIIKSKNAEDCHSKFENTIAHKKPESKTSCVEVKAETLGDCDNNPVRLNPITAGVVAKIPVVLAELTVRFNVNAKIDLPEPAIEIKRIKKKVKVVQCMLIQGTDILFIKGFVRKNIEFATKECSHHHGMCGDIRHCTVDVPFECTTVVKFNGTRPAPLVTNTSDEFEFFTSKELSNDFAEKDRLLSGDLSEFNQISTEFFNELTFCELISAKVVEFDEFLHRERPKHADLPVGEKLFTKIEEKMVIAITLKLLQNRQVAIGPTRRECPTEQECHRPC
ncbi:CsxC family protein [Alkaliphilus sp. B6464]|uniref:CsxC family protein n=1 Tax=Alkaliphilus sp. B6464 TaxID=2731219 RepID=UPI002010FF79|nr:hypothetical protein [Alkaliphilus sp. B6464]